MMNSDPGQSASGSDCLERAVGVKNGPIQKFKKISKATLVELPASHHTEGGIIRHTG